MPVRNLLTTWIRSFCSTRNLKRELLLVLMLKLLFLLSIRAAFFPHRLPEDAVVSGVQQRMFSHAENVQEPQAKPDGNESAAKDKQ